MPVHAFTRLIEGGGATVQLIPYDDVTGLAPGQLAVVFRSDGREEAEGDDRCPVEAAVRKGGFPGTGIGSAFRITTDVPVSVYRLYPWYHQPAMWGDKAITPLLPTSAWDVDYLAVNAAPANHELFPLLADHLWLPTLQLIARENGTRITITPVANVEPGPGVPGGPANSPLEIELEAGQYLQLTQETELTGSLVSSNRPIGLLAGHQCANLPADRGACDHLAQMVPPPSALGHRYVGVMYPPRVPAETSTPWRMVGLVDDTQLTYSSPVGGPTQLRRGEVVQFETGAPFVVSSQDADHPFLLFTYMTGEGFQLMQRGDPEFVLNVPPAQHLTRYVLFADTYQSEGKQFETTLVLVRRQGSADVYLDCVGTVQGWQAVDSEFEYAYVPISTERIDGPPLNACSTGRLELVSDTPFGVTIWGMGDYTSYGYPGGMRSTPIDEGEIR